MAIKRGEGQRLIPLEDLRERRVCRLSSQRILSTAEQIYERRWALALSGPSPDAFGRTNIVPLAGCGLFDQLQKLLTDESDRPSQAEIAANWP